MLAPSGYIIITNDTTLSKASTSAKKTRRRCSCKCDFRSRQDFCAFCQIVDIVDAKHAQSDIGGSIVLDLLLTSAQEEGVCNRELTPFQWL